MASASAPTRKRTSDSNLDDASVPTPKRTRDSNIDDDVNDKKEKMIKSLKDNPASVLALSKLLSCDACKSLARAPIRHSGHRHKICSICYTKGGDKCPAEGCTEKLMLRTFVHTEVTETIRVMKLPVQCRNRKNGCPKKGQEKEVEEHEIECEFRLVEPHGKMFKDILCKMMEFVKKRNGKWKWKDNDKTGKCVYRDSIGPDGYIFRIILNASNQFVFKAYAIVVGGERVANKYRVELRLNSSEKEFTHTHHGPVFSVDVKDRWNREEVFMIDKKRFMLFNKGFDYFGEHNQDKNGEITVPIMAKIIKKELDIPKEY